jgi:hypothetical protein
MDHARVDRPRAHGVHPDALARDFARRRLGEPDHRVLRRHIGRHARRPDEAGDGSGVDHGAAALTDHLRQDVAQAEENALHVHADHGVEHRLVVLRGRASLAFDAALLKKQSIRPNVSIAVLT